MDKNKALQRLAQDTSGDPLPVMMRTREPAATQEWIRERFTGAPLSIRRQALGALRRLGTPDSEAFRRALPRADMNDYQSWLNYKVQYPDRDIEDFKHFR